MNSTKSQPCLTWHSPSSGTGSFRHTGASINGKRQLTSQLPVSTVLESLGHCNPGLIPALCRQVNPLQARMPYSRYPRTSEMDSPSRLAGRTPTRLPSGGQVADEQPMRLPSGGQVVHVYGTGLNGGHPHGHPC